MSKGLGITFLIHAMFALIFGIAMYPKPGIWAASVNWVPFDPTMTRAFAAALLALGVSSWLGYRATRWEQVQIVIQTEIVFTVLGALAGIYGVWMGGAPAFAWVAIVIWLAFAAAWIYLYSNRPDQT